MNTSAEHNEKLIQLALNDESEKVRNATLKIIAEKEPGLLRALLKRARYHKPNSYLDVIIEIDKTKFFDFSDIGFLPFFHLSKFRLKTNAGNIACSGWRCILSVLRTCILFFVPFECVTFYIRDYNIAIPSVFVYFLFFLTVLIASTFVFCLVSFYSTCFRRKISPTTITIGFFVLFLALVYLPSSGLIFSIFYSTFFCVVASLISNPDACSLFSIKKDHYRELIMLLCCIVFVLAANFVLRNIPFPGFHAFLAVPIGMIASAISSAIFWGSTVPKVESSGFSEDFLREKIDKSFLSFREVELLVARIMKDTSDLVWNESIRMLCLKCRDSDLSRLISSRIFTDASPDKFMKFISEVERLRGVYHPFNFIVYSKLTYLRIQKSSMQIANQYSKLLYYGIATIIFTGILLLVLRLWNWPRFVFLSVLFLIILYLIYFIPKILFDFFKYYLPKYCDSDIFNYSFLTSVLYFVWVVMNDYIESKDNIFLLSLTCMAAVYVVSFASKSQLSLRLKAIKIFHYTIFSVIAFDTCFRDTYFERFYWEKALAFTLLSAVGVHAVLSTLQLVSSNRVRDHHGCLIFGAGLIFISLSGILLFIESVLFMIFGFISFAAAAIIVTLPEEFKVIGFTLDKYNYLRSLVLGCLGVIPGVVVYSTKHLALTFILGFFAPFAIAFFVCIYDSCRANGFRNLRQTLAFMIGVFLIPVLYHLESNSNFDDLILICLFCMIASLSSSVFIYTTYPVCRFIKRYLLDVKIILDFIIITTWFNVGGLWFSLALSSDLTMLPMIWMVLSVFATMLGGIISFIRVLYCLFNKAKSLRSLAK